MPLLVLKLNKMQYASILYLSGESND